MGILYYLRVGVGSRVPAAFLGLFLLLCFNTGFAQVGLTNGAPTAFIDFSNTTPPAVGTAPASNFQGKGFEPNPTIAGRLNSNAWEVKGFSDGALLFGGTRIGGDLGRGQTAVAVATGGVYAYTGAPHSAANPALMVQPASSDFTPGSITLRIQNNGTSPITQFEISYDLFVRNDQERANSFNFSWSTNNTTFNAVPALDYTSIEASDALGWVQVGTSPSRSTIIGSQNIAPGAYFYIRWNSADVSGTLIRDEFGLDNIDIKATYGVPCTPPSYNANATFSGVMPGQMTLNFTRGNGTGGLMIVAVANATLSANATNGVVYTANPNFGYGDAIGNGFVVYNSNAVSPGSPGGTGSITLYNLDPSTTYNFYLIEYNVISNPCYQQPPLTTKTQATPALTQSASGYFRSLATGNWNDATKWQWSPDNVSWSACQMRPSGSASGIDIRSPHKITLTANATAALLTIQAGAILSNTNTNGGYDLVVNDKTGDDLVVNGTLELFGNAPTFISPANAVINTGGLVDVKNNNTPALSDDFARNPNVKFYTDAVFNWGIFLGFETSGATYFPSGGPDIPIFRISVNITAGSSGVTIVNGRLDVVANLTLANSGVKTFRNGITGTGTLTQNTGSGALQVNASAANGGYVIGGTGVINLAGDLQVAGGGVGELISNKTVNGGNFKILSNGYLNTDIYTVSGTTNFEVQANGILGIGSPAGITTGALGNIQTTTRTMSTDGSYRYTGYVNQATGNLLPASVKQLQLMPATPGIVISLSQPLTIASNFIMAYASPVTYGIFDINGSSLTIASSIANAGNAGSITGNSTSALTMSGTTGQNLFFTPASALGLFTLNKPSGTVIFSNTQGGISIYEGIYFDPTHGGGINFSNQPVTLKSTNTHTAYFSRVYGTVQNATKFTVERYIPADEHGKSWQLLSVPLNTTQTINQAWQDTATSANQNRYSGYGTQIAADISDPTYTLGFDALATIGATVKTFNPATNKWDNIGNTKSTSIKNQKGYMTFVRGDRSVTTYNGTATATTLRATGALYYLSGASAPPVTSVTANQFESVGNPYACAIDFDLLTRAGGVDKTFYVWDPELTSPPNSAYGLGGYQTISSTVGYVPIPGGTSNYPSGIPVSTIESGQAVLIHATGTNGGLVFSEAAKVTSSNNVFRTPVPVSMLQAHLYRRDGVQADGNVAVFDARFSDVYSGDDALKIPHGTENMDITSWQKNFSVFTRKSVRNGDSLFYNFSNLTPQIYTLEFNPVNFDGPEEVWLIDRYTGAMTLISRTEPTRYSMEVTTIAASKQAGRLYIIFGHPKGQLVDEAPAIVVSPNPVRIPNFRLDVSRVTPGNYTAGLYRMDGNKVWEQRVFVTAGSAGLPIQLTSKPPAGMYYIQLSNGVRRLRCGIVIL